MRQLGLSDESKKAIESLVEFASRPENHYRVGTSKWDPGDRPEFVHHVNTFRLVFTVTDGRGVLYRHMTVFAPAKSKMPNPLVAFTLATWCGFTGGKRKEKVTIKPGPDWGIGAHKKHHCIVLTQKIHDS